MKNRAYLIVGPERTGTRLTQRLLIDSGCKGVATTYPRPEWDGNPQLWDYVDPKPEDGDIVLRRTFPYHPHRKWFPLAPLVDRFKKAGMKPILVVTLRDYLSTAKALARAKFVLNENQGLAECSRAYREIQTYIANHKIDVHYVSYEMLTSGSPQMRIAMLENMGLTPKKRFEKMHNGNIKYYEQGN